MDGVSIAASIVGIASAGVQVSIKLVTLAAQISTASDRVSAIGNDISLTSGVLHQLGELMTQKSTDDGVSIFNQNGLETTKTSAAMCERVFKEAEKEVKKASEQLRNYKPGRGRMSGEKIELSTTEKAKWPFLQPKIDTLRADLRDAKSTLMLMLQVASLALSKRMADASIPSSEHQDYVRAIVALELERREESKNSTGQPGRPRRPNSNDTPNAENANTISSGDHSLNSGCNPQQSSSLAQARGKHTVEVNKSQKGFSDTNVRGLLDTSTGTGVGRSKGLEPEDILKLPLVTSPGSKFPRTNENSKVHEDRTNYFSNPSPSSDKDSETQKNHDTELQLFLLKPIVKDLFDRIELRWSVQNSNMPPLAVREHMAKNEKEDIPSVVETLQQLHAYEQAMVDSETYRDSGGILLSIKRTKTDIQSRDIILKGVPGLQFVIQRQIRQPPPSSFYGGKTSGQAPLPVPKSQKLVSSSSRSHHQDKPKSRRNGLASVFTFLQPFAKKRKGKERRGPVLSNSFEVKMSQPVREGVGVHVTRAQEGPSFVRRIAWILSLGARGYRSQRPPLATPPSRLESLWEESIIRSDVGMAGAAFNFSEQDQEDEPPRKQLQLLKKHLNASEETFPGDSESGRPPMVPNGSTRNHGDTLDERDDEADLGLGGLRRDTKHVDSALDDFDNELVTGLLEKYTFLFD